MNVIVIDPWNKEVRLAKLESLDGQDNEFIENLPSKAIPVEDDLKIASYPIIGKEKHFFYYITQKGDIAKILPFEGMGIVFGNVSEKRVEEVKDSIVWH